MSRVNHALLSFSVLEDEHTRIREVNAALDARGREQFRDACQRDQDTDPWWGGTKFPEVSLWGAALNYVTLDTVMDAVRAASWKYPDEVQVIWQAADDDLWSLHRLEEDDEGMGTALDQVGSVVPVDGERR